MTTTADCEFQLILTEEIPELVITAPVVSFVEVEATGLPGAPGKDSPGLIPMPFAREGGQYVKVGKQKFTIEYDAIALGLRVSLVEPPVGADFIVALRINGTVIVRATIPDGAETSGYILVPHGIDTISAGDYATLDVEQVGSTLPGTTLTATFWMKVVA